MSKKMITIDICPSTLPNRITICRTRRRPPLLEAQARSAIENIVTNTDALLRHAQKEALRYRTALKAGFDSLQKRPLMARDLL